MSNSGRDLLHARYSGGFTLIELMVTLAVVAVVIVIAAPSLREAFMNVRMSAQANDLMSDLALARGEAIKRGLPVRLCPATTGTPPDCVGTQWAVGWIVFVDDNNNGVRNGTELVLRRREPVATGNTIVVSPGASNIPFRPSGVSNITATTTTFTMCDGRTTAHRGRVITIGPTGRVVATRITCS